MSSTNPPAQTIRTAHFSELYTCATILAKSFKDEVLFGQHIHTNRDKYPDDMAMFWYGDLITDWFDWSMDFVVSTETDQDGKEVITGFAQWHRKGKGATEAGWGLGWWDPRRLLTPLSKCYSTLITNIYPNRALHPDRGDVLQRSDPFSKHIFAALPDHWYLHFLGVHPEHQGKGIGRLLVSQGIERARRERIGACVISAHGKDPFYQRCGFETVIGSMAEGEGNPIADVPGGNIWWVDFGKKGKGVVDGKGEAEARKR